MGKTSLWQSVKAAVATAVQAVKSAVVVPVVQAFKKLAAPVVAGGSLVLAGSANAQATLPTGVAAAVTDAGEVLQLGAVAVITVGVAFWGIHKLGKRMGWW